MVTRQPLHCTLSAHVTQHRWHFWCTEMAPSGKESAHSTFANFTMSEGPDEAVASAPPPAFPEDKKKEYLSRTDLRQVEKNERISAGQQKCRPHNFVPLCDGTKTVCDVLNFYLFSQPFGRYFATNACTSVRWGPTPYHQHPLLQQVRQHPLLQQVRLCISRLSSRNTDTHTLRFLLAIVTCCQAKSVRFPPVPRSFLRVSRISRTATVSKVN